VGTALTKCHVQQIAQVVADSLWLPRAERKVTKEEVVRLLCIQQCNSFGITDGEDDLIGVALYPELAVFNHSCTPTPSPCLFNQT